MVQTISQKRAATMYKNGKTVWLAQANLPHHLNGREHIGYPVNVKGDGAFEDVVKNFRKGTVRVMGALTFRVKP